MRRTGAVEIEKDVVGRIAAVYEARIGVKIIQIRISAISHIIIPRAENVGGRLSVAGLVGIDVDAKGVVIGPRVAEKRVAALACIERGTNIFRMNSKRDSIGAEAGEIAKL